MKLYLRCLIFIVSLLILLVAMIIEYKIGKKLGLKKALYRITFRLVTVILAFLISPYLNEYILNYDLYKAKLAIHYNGMNFYRIIDFIEEVIVHNEVLNDIYNMFPSLKNILMDFPQVLCIPFTYVIAFILISIITAPLYLWLSYRRKRRVLYEKSINKKSAIWAGVLSSALAVFLFSIILTPINGVARMYNDSRKDLVESDSNICKQSSYLVKYDIACEIIEGYNSSVLYYIGSNPLNQYFYSSMTRIKYDNKDTSINNEIVSVARAGLVLNKIGILEAIQSTEFTIDNVQSLRFNTLTEEDIDVVVAAFEKSAYTKDVVFEVYEWSKAYLDWLIRDVMDKDFNSQYEYEDIVGELKLVLKAINYITNSPDCFESLVKFAKIIYDFSQLSIPEQNAKGERFFFDMSYSVPVDHMKALFTILKDSKIYRDFVPQILDHLLSTIGVRSYLRFDDKEMERLVYYGLELIRIVQNHKYIHNVLHMFNDLTKDEVHYLAEVMNYLTSTRVFKDFARDIWEYGMKQINMKLELPYDIVYDVKDWTRELEVVHLALQIAYTAVRYEEVDYDKIWEAISNYRDTVCFQAALKMVVEHLGEVFEMFLFGKGIKYVVGEYIMP